MTQDKIIQSAKGALAAEARGLEALRAALDGPLGDAVAQAVQRIGSGRGRLIVTGMGKSGHVARKIAATMASTGTPAIFVHPAEASHGDLGMITADDVIMALSWSGETRELHDILHYARRFGVALIGITGEEDSALGRAAEIVLNLPRAEEACPNGLAPTTSALMQLAIGDALAVALLEARGFTAADFGVYHPGGKLGAALKTVGDIMHGAERLPLAQLDTPLRVVIGRISEFGFGCCGIVNADGVLTGIVTDGDLRRHVGLLPGDGPVSAVMSRQPRTVRAGQFVGDAIQLINKARITALFVVDAAGRPVGIVHVHDLLAVGLA